MPRIKQPLTAHKLCVYSFVFLYLLLHLGWSILRYQGFAGHNEASQLQSCLSSLLVSSDLASCRHANGLLLSLV